MKESLHVYQRKPELNRDIGMKRSEVWNAVIQSPVFFIFFYFYFFDTLSLLYNLST